MQELKVQNSLLLQLVTGLQNQINSKNRENQILFQQYEQLANDNRSLQQANDSLRLQQSHPARQNNIPTYPDNYLLKKLEQQVLQLKVRSQQVESRRMKIEQRLRQKQGYILFLESEKEQKRLAEEKSGQDKKDSLLVEQVIASQNKQAWEQHQQAIKRLTTTNQQLTDIIALKQQTITQLSAVIDGQTSTISANQENISSLNQQTIHTINRYDQQLNQQQQIIRQLTEQYNNHVYNEQAGMIQPSGGPAYVKIKELEDILSSKQQSILELSQFLMQQSKKMQGIDVKSAEGKDETGELKRVIEQKQQSISELGEFLNTISQKNRQLEDEIAAIKQRGNNMQDSSEGNEQKASAYQALISDLREAIKERQVLSAQIQSKQQAITDLNDLLKQKDSSLVDFTEFIGTQTDRIIKLEAQLDGSQKAQSQQQIQSYRLRIDDLEQILKCKEQSISELGQYLGENYSKIFGLEEEVKVSKSEHAQLAQRLQQLKAQLQQSQANSMRHDFQNIKQTAENIAQKGQSQSQPTQIELIRKKSLLQQILSSLQLKITDSKSIAQELQTLLEQKSLQLQAIKNTLHTKEQEQEELLDSIQNLKQQRQEFMKTAKQGEQQQFCILQQAKVKQQALQAYMRQLLLQREQPTDNEAGDNNFMQVLSSLQQELADKSQNIETLILQKQALRLQMEQLREASAVGVEQLRAEYEKIIGDKELQGGMIMQILQNLQKELKEKDETIQKLNGSIGLNIISQSKSVGELQLLNYKHIIAEHQSSILQNRQVIMHLQSEIESLKEELEEVKNTETIAPRATFSQYSSPLPLTHQPHPPPTTLQAFKQLTIQRKLEQLLVLSVGRQREQQRGVIVQWLQLIKGEYLGEAQSRGKECGQLKQALDNLLGINNCLLEQVSDLKNKQERKDGQIQQWGEKMIKKEEQVKAYMLQLQKISTLITHLQQQLEKATQHAKINKENEESLTGQLSFLKQQLAEHQKAKQKHLLKQAEQQHLQQQAKQQHLQQQAEQRQRLQHLSSEIQHLKHQLHKINTENLSKQNYINELNEEIVRLHRESSAKEISVEQLKSEKATKFYKEFNNLLDSDIANRQEQLEVELEKVAAERDQVMEQHHAREGEMQLLREKYESVMKELCQLRERARQAERNSVAEKQVKMDEQQCEQAIGSNVSLKNGQPQSVDLPPVLMNTNEFHNASNTSARFIQEIQELQDLLQEKDCIICQLQGSIFQLQKGYNKETMSLRKSIAQLTQQTIVLQKKIYEIDPNLSAITHLIKNNIAHRQESNIYKSQISIARDYSRARSHYNNSQQNSYYSQYEQPSRQRFKGFSPILVKQNLNLGQRMMGRKCSRTANPSSSFFLPSYINNISNNSRIVEFSRAIAQKN